MNKLPATRLTEPDRAARPNSRGLRGKGGADELPPRALTKYQRYDRSEKGRARRRRYNRSAKGCARRRRYKVSELGRAASRRFDASPAGKMLKKLRDMKPARKLQKRLYMQNVRQFG